MQCPGLHAQPGIAFATFFRSRSAIISRKSAYYLPANQFLRAKTSRKAALGAPKPHPNSTMNTRQPVPNQPFRAENGYPPGKETPREEWAFALLYASALPQPAQKRAPEAFARPQFGQAVNAEVAGTRLLSVTTVCCGAAYAGGAYIP